MELQIVGTMVKDNNHAKILDFLRDKDLSCCFIKLLGNAQVLKSFWLEIAKFANRDKNVGQMEGTSGGLLHTKFELSLTSSYRLSTLSLSDSSRYSKIETLLDYGYASYTIYKESIFSSPNMIFVKNESENELLDGFKRWASKIALPIPNDEALIKAMFEHFFEYEGDVRVIRSETEEVSAISIDNSICQYDYEKIRKFVEQFYQKKEGRVA